MTTGTTIAIIVAVIVGAFAFYLMEQNEDLMEKNLALMREKPHNNTPKTKNSETMNKVVFNPAHGGFCLSRSAMLWLAANGREEIRAIVNKYLEKQPDNNFGFHTDEDIKRHDPDLVRCVEALGHEADGRVAKLEVRELKGNRYRIEEYDGWEYVYEPEDEEYITIESDGGEGHWPDGSYMSPTPSARGGSSSIIPIPIP